MKTEQPVLAIQSSEGQEAAAYLRGKLTEAPYRGQWKGPIPYHGTTSYVECASCSIARGRPTAVPRRFARQHLRDHKSGLKAVV